MGLAVFTSDAPAALLPHMPRDLTAASADDTGLDDDNVLKQAQQAQGATALMLASCIHDAAVAVSATRAASSSAPT